MSVSTDRSTSPISIDFLISVIYLGFPLPYVLIPSFFLTLLWGGRRKNSFWSSQTVLCPLFPVHDLLSSSDPLARLFSPMGMGKLLRLPECSGVATESALGSWVDNFSLPLHASPSSLTHLGNPITCFQPWRRGHLTKLIAKQWKM